MGRTPEAADCDRDGHRLPQRRNRQGKIGKEKSARGISRCNIVRSSPGGIGFGSLSLNGCPPWLSQSRA
jgi:hypothetical protein